MIISAILSQLKGDKVMTTAVIIVIAAIVGFASYFVTKDSNNPIEVVAEDVIDKELGVPQGTIHLTPETKPAAK